MNFSSWDKLPIKQQLGLFSVSIVLIAYLLYIFILEPQWTHIDELKKQYQVEEQKVKVIETFALAHPDMDGYLFELDNKIIAVDKLLPDTPEVSSFVLQVEQLAQESGVELSYIKPGKVDNKQGYREIAVELSIKGTFPGMMSFLHKTEGGSRFITIGTISTQIGAKGLESKMLAKIYSHGVAAAPAATPAPTPPANK